MSAPTENTGVETTPADVPRVAEEAKEAKEAAPVTETLFASIEPEVKATDAPAPETEAVAQTEVPKADAAEVAAAEAAPDSPKKNPGLLSKLLAPFQKVRGPKSPKKLNSEAAAAAATTEEVPEPPVVATEMPADPPAVVHEDVAPAEPAEPVVEPASVPRVEEQDKTSEMNNAGPALAAPSPPAKTTRRLSARVTGFFRPKAKSGETSPLPLKVDENPPKIDEPTPVAPLENLNAENGKAAQEPPKSAPAPAPEVAATA